MEGYAKQKIVGGKLVAIKLEYSEKIEKIQILGDFFIFPEKTLQEIENCLIGTMIDESEDEIANKIAVVVKANDAELVGITPEAIAKTIKMAVAR